MPRGLYELELNQSLKYSSAVCDEGQSVAFVLYLLQCGVGGFITLELEQINEIIGFDFAVNTSGKGMHLAFRKLTKQGENKIDKPERREIR